MIILRLLLLVLLEVVVILIVVVGGEAVRIAMLKLLLLQTVLMLQLPTMGWRQRQVMLAEHQLLHGPMPHAPASPCTSLQ
jgi:hypothetical protein